MSSSPSPDAGTPHLVVQELLDLPPAELVAWAESLGIADAAASRRSELLQGVLRAELARGGSVRAEGVLEVLPDGFGFLRATDRNYLADEQDVYVAAEEVRRLGACTGDTLAGAIRPPNEEGRGFALTDVDRINGEPPELRREKRCFDDLTPLYPETKFDLEGEAGGLVGRVIDLIAPLGKGQRALVTSPPKAGKTMTLGRIANAIRANHPDAMLLVLLIDERPEEVTDMRRGVDAEVVASTFDAPAPHHVQVADMVLEKAKRQVEYGHDVVILLDSITRLARAHNTVAPHSGRILSGGVDANALHKPKRFFGAARNVEEGGSLTIVGTALVDTGSRMDEVIFEEFKGTGNSEIVLDRKLADRRTFPAIDLDKSSTRREELLLAPEALARMTVLRKVLAPLSPVDSMEFLLEKLQATDTNEAFLASMSD